MNLRDAPRAIRGLLIGAGLLSLGASVALAGTGVEYEGIQTIRLRNGVNGYAGCKDTYINSGSSTTNFGACDTLKVSGPAWTGYRSGQNKILMSWDIRGVLGPNDIVVDAYLRLYQCVGYAATAYDTMDVRRVARAWTEGTGGCGGTTAQANWTHRMSGVNWQTVGAAGYGTGVTGNVLQWSSIDSTLGSGFYGTDTLFTGDSNNDIDVAKDPIAQTMFKVGGGAARQGWVAVKLTAQVRRWQIGANAENGVILTMHNTGINRAYMFFSSNRANINYRPELVMRVLSVTGTATGGGVTRRGVPGTTLGKN